MTAEERLIKAIKEMTDNMQLAELYDAYNEAEHDTSAESNFIRSVIMLEIENRLNPEQFKEWYEDNVK